MDGKTTREPEDVRRLEGLPAHEDDSDVANTVGGGVMSQGGTAVDYGTGEMGGVAQGPATEDEDEEGINHPATAPTMATMPGATIGIVDYTQGKDRDAGDGPAGERPLDMNRRPGDLGYEDEDEA